MKPVNAVQIIREALAAYGQHAATVLTVSLLINGVGLVASILMMNAFGMLGLFMFAMITVATQQVSNGAFASLMSSRWAGEDLTSAQDVIRPALARVGALCGAAFLFSLGVGVASIFFLLPGIYLATKWAVVFPAIVIGRRGVSEAFGQSSQYTSQAMDSVFAVVLFNFLLSVITPRIITGVAGGEMAPMEMTIIATFAISTIFGPISGLAIAELYLRLAPPVSAGGPTVGRGAFVPVAAPGGAPSGPWVPGVSQPAATAAVSAPYGAAAPAPYGAPAPGQPPYGSAPAYGTPATPGYGAVPGYGAAPQQPPYGGAPQQPYGGAAPQQQPYGGAPQQAYGAPAPQQPYGAPAQQPYGAPPTYGAPAQPYGAPHQPGSPAPAGASAPGFGPQAAQHAPAAYGAPTAAPGAYGAPAAPPSYGTPAPQATPPAYGAPSPQAAAPPAYGTPAPAAGQPAAPGMAPMAAAPPAHGGLSQPAAAPTYGAPPVAGAMPPGLPAEGGPAGPVHPGREQSVAPPGLG